MRVTIQHGLKVPGEQDYSSRQHSIAVDLDVPPEIASDKARLKAYVESVGANVRRQVEEALGQAPAEANAPRQTNGRSNGRESRRVGKPSRNGSSRGSRGGSTQASGRQVLFIRSLGREARFSPAQLDALCEENFGCRVADLSKKSASDFIEILREEIP